MKKDFYVFRHGETDLNKLNCWQGSGTDWDLNAKGIAQAQLLVDKMSDKNLEVIFSSPLKRAKQTADILGKSINCPVLVEDDLRECFYGDAEGKPLEEFAEYVKIWKNPDLLDVAIPNGEKRGDALKRVLMSLEKLAREKYNVMGIAVHCGTMFSLLSYFKFIFEDIPNCGVFHLVYDDGKWFIEGNLF